MYLIYSKKCIIVCRSIQYKIVENYKNSLERKVMQNLLEVNITIINIIWLIAVVIQIFTQIFILLGFFSENNIFYMTGA